MPRTSTLPVGLPVLLALLALAPGCSGCDKPADNTVDAAPTTSALPASSSAAVVAVDGGAPEGGAEDPGRKHGMRRGGPSAMLFEAARGLELTPETLKKVDDADKLSPPPGENAAVKEAAKELHAEIVTGIKAGKIDTAKVEPKYLTIEKLTIAEHDKEVASLNALHASLDGAQRKAVVASVRAKQAKRDEARAAHGGGNGGRDGGGADAGKPHAAKRNLDRMLRGLELDAEQQKKIDAMAPKDEGKAPGADPAEAKKKLETLLTAFEKDTFDAKKSDGFDAKRNRVVLEDQTKLLGQVLPVLKPEQRDKLAINMERGPSAHAPRRPAMGHRPLLEPEEDDFAP